MWGKKPTLSRTRVVTSKYMHRTRFDYKYTSHPYIDIEYTIHPIHRNFAVCFNE